MANHSRDDINKDKTTGDLLIAGALGALGLFAKSSIEKSRNNDKARNEIIRINNRINKLKGEFLGSFTNAEEIERLEAERSNWEKQLRS